LHAIVYKTTERTETMTSDKSKQEAKRRKRETPERIARSNAKAAERAAREYRALVDDAYTEHTAVY
jgi:Ribonuclease G/E